MAGALLEVDADLYAGARIRALRKRSKLTLHDLSTRTGISAKQLQKFETGGNRLNATALFRISKGLGVRVESLFPDCPVETAADSLEKARQQLQVSVSDCENVKLLAAIRILIEEASR